MDAEETPTETVDEDASDSGAGEQAGAADGGEVEAAVEPDGADPGVAEAGADGADADTVDDTTEPVAEAEPTEATAPAAADDAAPGRERFEVDEAEPAIVGQVERPMVPTEDLAGPDTATFIALGVAVLVAIFLFVAFRRQRRRRREEMAHADESPHPETEAPHIPEEALPPPGEGQVPVPPVEEGPPASPEAAPAAQTTEERRRAEEKEARRQAFLAEQRAAREAKEQEEAERRAAEDAAAAEKLREAEEAAQRAAEEAARREALLASSGPLTERLAKTRSGFVGRLNGLFGGKTIDEDTLEALEEVLFTADIGVQTAGDLLETVRESLKKKELADPARIRQRLKERIAETLGKNGHVSGKEALDPADAEKRPYVIMVVGVNGVGKTTTIGKLAGRYVAQGKKVILAAGDTFRAAAVEQLEVWGDRVGCEVVRGPEGADPGSVTFEAVQKGVNEGADVVIADTAGRLHTKAPLMEELRKVHRVLGKARDGAPDEVLLVVDATTGQNALQQAKMFREAVPVSGIALTKLDGTAKGGVVIGITGELDLPVRYIGVGEKVGDLQPFDPRGFVEALFG